MYVFTPVVCVFVTVIVSPERRNKPFITAVYNMVCSALFLQRALYTVHCTNIMHSTKPSFVITPPFLVDTVNRYFVYTRK